MILTPAGIFTAGSRELSRLPFCSHVQNGAPRRGPVLMGQVKVPSWSVSGALRSPPGLTNISGLCLVLVLRYTGRCYRQRRSGSIPRNLLGELN